MNQDQAEIIELVERERSARDGGLWEEMAACYHPDSKIEVSWFQGPGAGFVEATRANFARGRVSLHHLGATVVSVNQKRALADMGCQMMGFNNLGGVDVCVVNHTRLLWRALKHDGQWLIAGLRMIYIRDVMLPCNPARVPVIDEAEAGRYRQSYRYLSYVLARSPNLPNEDLPGTDRPETVAALRAGEKQWLLQS